LQKIFAGHSLLELAHELRYPDIDGLYSAVGDGMFQQHPSSIS